MIDLISDKKEIENIINTKIRGKRLIFTDWYKMGIMRKGIPEEKFNEVFPQFGKVFKIEKEDLKQGGIGYELFYELSNNTTFSIATIPKNEALIIIHIVEYKRKLDERFRKLKK